MTREAFENAIVVCSALGGSTNAPIHLNAMAAHVGVQLDNDDWERIGHAIPLLVDLQPAGRFLGEDFFRAGGVPAVVAELLDAGALPHPDAVTVNGRTIGENCAGRFTDDREVIRSFAAPMLQDAGFLNLKGNLFDSAIMKTSVISASFRERYLSDPDDPDAFEGRVVVFDGREDYHARINDPSLEIDADTLLVMRGAGPIGHPGAAEIVNMQPPDALLVQGIEELPCIGDGRQSGTSGSPSILNASPEAAVGGGLALLRTGDRVRIDLRRRTADVLLTEAELAARRAELGARLEDGGLPYVPASQTPWQEIQRGMVGQLAQGMLLEPAVRFQDIGHGPRSIPRDNH
jgi:dihydroxy-acid dehydratase